MLWSFCMARMVGGTQRLAYQVRGVRRGVPALVVRVDDQVQPHELVERREVVPLCVSSSSRTRKEVVMSMCEDRRGSHEYEYELCVIKQQNRERSGHEYENE